MCYKILNNHVWVVVDSFFTRRAGYYTRGTVLNYIRPILPRSVMVTSSLTASLKFGTPFLAPLFNRPLLLETLLCNLGAYLSEQVFCLGVPFNTFSFVLFLYACCWLFGRSSSIHVVFFVSVVK